MKRCVAVAGDTLSVVNGQVYINSFAQTVWPGIQTTYTVTTDGTRINLKKLEKFGYVIIPPEKGMLANGNIGDGRMPSEETLVDYVFY